MLLERIRLRGFGCFQRQDFELRNGINLIFGPNFSGKSTLVNAIFFTLTGRPIVPRVAVASIKRAKSYSGTAGLQFSSNDERYQLYRGTGKRIQLRCERGETWHVVFDEERVKVTESMLRDRFGLRHEQLALTTFLREGEIFEFLARQAANRRDILHTLLGIDRLIDVRQRFIDTRRIAKREQNRIHAHQNSLRFTAQKANGPEIERIETRLRAFEAAYGAQTEDAGLIAEWRQQERRLQKELETLTAQQLEALGGFKDRAHLQETITSVATAIQETGGLEAERDGLIQQIGRLESQVTALTQVCETLRALISSDEQHCPTCYQQVEREVVEQIIAEKETEKSRCSAELETYKQTLETKTSDLKNRNVLQQRLLKLQGLSTQLHQRANDIDQIQTELRKIRVQLEENGVQQTEPPSDDSVEGLDKHELKSRIDSDRKQLDKLKQTEAVRLDRFAALQRVNADAIKVEKTLLSLELACTGIDRTIEVLQRQILQPAEAELHRWLERMQLFGVTQIDLQREHLLPSLNIDGTERSLLLLSGSEKMFLYLCFKVVLAKILGNPGFFVFDDPTLHLDDERKTLMVDLIRELAEEYQVIVTSYDEDVRAGLEGGHLIEMARE